VPLTLFQKEVLAILVRHRSEASHFAGGLILNAPDDSLRYSRDFDLFHEAVEVVAENSERDVRALLAAGLEVVQLERGSEWREPSSFRQALVCRGEESLTLDWAYDSAFRYFPIEKDPLLGWRLHLFDMATNKALALSSRTETRDYVDIVALDKRYPLEAIVWAACGKDPGFSPLFLLKMMRRFAKINMDDLEKIQARKIDPVALKMEWITMCDRAETAMTRLADSQIDMPIGVAFVDREGQPRWIGERPDLRPHAPSKRGCWPTIHGLDAW